MRSQDGLKVMNNIVIETSESTLVELTINPISSIINNKVESKLDGKIK